MDLLKRNIIYIIVSFVFILGQFARIPLGENVYLIGIDIIVGLIVLIGFTYILLVKKEVLKDISKYKFIRYLFLFFTIALVSLVVNAHLLNGTQFVVSFLYLVRLFGYYLFFILILALPLDAKRKVQQYMVWVGGAVVFIGVVQLLYYPNLRNLYYLGWDDHYFRVFSIFLDPNFAGLFFVLYFFQVLILATNYLKEKGYLKYFYLGLSLITFIVLILTFSRTALIALIVSSAIFLYHIKKLKYLLLMLLILILSFLFLNNSKYESLNLLRTASIDARITGSENALKLIADKPVLGVGFNAYRYALERSDLTSQGEYPQHGEAGADNSFLFVSATTGLLGLIIFSLMWWKIIIMKKSSLLSVLSIVIMFVGSIFINALFYNFLLFWLFLILGTTQKSSR